MSLPLWDTDPSTSENIYYFSHLIELWRESGHFGNWLKKYYEKPTKQKTRYEGFVVAEPKQGQSTIAGLFT